MKVFISADIEGITGVKKALKHISAC